MAKNRVIPENQFEDNVIHTYKHFLNKSRGYFQGDLFDAIQTELESLNKYEDDAINHAYKYYDSKLQHKIDLFAKIGATELESAFLFEQSALAVEIGKMPIPAKEVAKKFSSELVGMIKQIGKESGMETPKPKGTVLITEQPEMLYEVTIDGKKEVWSYAYLQKRMSDEYELELSKTEMQQYFDKSIKKKQGFDLIGYAEDLGYNFQSDRQVWIPTIAYQVSNLDKGEDVQGKKLFTTRSGSKITMITAIPFNQHIVYTDYDSTTKTTDTKSFDERHPEVSSTRGTTQGTQQGTPIISTPTPQVPTDLYWVIMDKNMGYVGKNIQNNLPFFEFKKKPENADRYRIKEEAEDVAIILEQYFKNGSFSIVQEELPMMKNGGKTKNKY